MSKEHPEILFEKRDTNTPAVTQSLAWMMAVMVVCSILMIPLTHYLWKITAQPTQIAASIIAPNVVLEVFPSQEIHKMNSQTSENQDHEKINTVMSNALEAGFAVRKS